MNSAWLALILSLPTRNATARMRVWRSLKTLGCAVLRDGVYVLPLSDTARAAFSREAAAVLGAGGSANVVELAPTDAQQHAAWRELFDRSEDYLQLTRTLQSLQGTATSMRPAALARKLASLQRNFAEIDAIDFFPGAARDQAQRLLQETERAVRSVLAPDEPQAVARPIPNVRRADYRRRTWATRRQPWVDRLASAWLIKRFIDRDAKFLWIDKPRDCPAHAVGFDFDGAEFTHVGDRVTFEVLLAAFALEQDPGLRQLGLVVHYLDVGGLPAEDASGIHTVLVGARGRTRTDDQLLSDALTIFDFVYSAYQEQAENDT